MADDDSPISSTVTETVTTDTGADKETAESLNSAFDDFWAGEDKKSPDAPEAPAAPGESETRETKEQKSEPRQPRSTTDLKPETEDTKEYTDDDIERLALTHINRPEAIEGFKQLKSGWKAERVRAKAAIERAEKAERDLSEARQNAWTPETKADYDHAVAIRRKFDFVSDPEFQAKFHAPIQTKYHELLNEIVDFLPNRALAVDWAKDVAARYSYDSTELTKHWWNHDVIDKIPDETDKATVRQGLANLLRMQKERETEIQRRTNDKSSYDNWIKERDLSKSQQEMKEVMDEIGIQEQKPFIKERLRKDADLAKTKEEREAIEKHNEEFEKLNGRFQETMKDLTFNGPRARVRAAIEAGRVMYLEGEYKEMEKRAKSAESERDQLRSELEKIQGARRRISNTTGTPPASASKDKNGQGLSLKGLDVRDAFKDFDWKDGS